MHTTIDSTAARRAATTRHGTYTWRVVDIVVAAVVAVAAGIVFWLWDFAATPVTAPIQAALPGLQGIVNGMWLFAGPLVGLIVRKPGAALFGELVAAAVEALIPQQFGASALLSGVVQGLGAEIVLAIFLYRSSSLLVAVLAGALAGVGESVLDLIVWYPGEKLSFDALYSVSTVVSGAVIAGLGSWLLLRALARTGVLSRFASARSSTAEI